MNDLNDEALRTTAQRLGTRAAERLDVEATASAVLEQLRRPAARDDRWSAPMWLRIAAALLVIVGATLVVRAGGPRPAELTVVSTDADLQALSTSELEELLGSLDETLNLAVPQVDSTSQGLDELTPDELRVMLRTLEG